MKTLVSGLREEDFMTLRWNADVHTVRRRTGEYRILNNRGICLGEMIEENGSYNIKIYEDTNETETIRKVSEEIINKKIEEPKVIDFLAYRSQQRPRIISSIHSKRVTTYYPISLRPAA
jgi:hypothetical protein